MGGATQWRIECPHIEDRPSELCMASEVSANNKGHWARENRVPDGVDASDLGEVLEKADDDPVVVCNSCRRVIILGNEYEVVHGPDPYCKEWGLPEGFYSDGGTRS